MQQLLLPLVASVNTRNKEPLKNAGSFPQFLWISLGVNLEQIALGRIDSNAATH